MSAMERVTVSLPAEIRRTAQEVADEEATSFSAVVVDALEAWLRGRRVDAWLGEHQDRAGDFDEDDLRALAREAGVAYLPPGRRRRTR